VDFILTGHILTSSITRMSLTEKSSTQQSNQKSTRLSAKQWLQRIHELDLPEKVRILNVCGGHERTITQAGLRTALPVNIELIPGPGCPVCVCPEEDIFDAIQLALNEDIILVVFGDMLRVPVNVPKREIRSLEQAKAAGADIRPIASPMEAIQIASSHADKTIVFFAAGFETTMAPVAAMLAAGAPDNLKVLLSGRLTWPAVAMLLQSGDAQFDALVAPGHVATIMGPEEWQFVVDDYGLPTAVAGFSPESLLAAFYSILRQRIEGKVFLDNCYADVVMPGGNAMAKQTLADVMDVTDAHWRGIGSIADSGFQLSKQYAGFDARHFFTWDTDSQRKHAGDMPPGCDCTRVILGNLYPNQCRLYGNACTPRSPIGPCMVSDEGACRIWWSGGLRPVDSTEPTTKILV
jgi:hydrogenase expression/formation protein HypD